MIDDELFASIESDWATAKKLSCRRKAMLRYAVKLTLTPSEMCKDDIEKLRDVEFSDIDILHIAEIAGYYAYVNRIADGLGVELEE